MVGWVGRELDSRSASLVCRDVIGSDSGRRLDLRLHKKAFASASASTPLGGEILPPHPTPNGGPRTSPQHRLHLRFQLHLQLQLNMLQSIILLMKQIERRLFTSR